MLLHHMKKKRKEKKFKAQIPKKQSKEQSKNRELYAYLSLCKACEPSGILFLCVRERVGS
jgi:hypothetical protein